MSRMLKPGSLECNSKNIKGRHDRLCDNRNDLAQGFDKDKHDQKKPLEA